MEFHIARDVRQRLNTDDLLFSYTGNVVFANVAASRKLAQQLNDARGPAATAAGVLNAGALFAMGLIDELNHAMVARYRAEVDPAVLSDAIRWFAAQADPEKLERLLLTFTQQFPNVAVYRGEESATEWLAGATDGLPNREAALEELLLLWLANINPAFTPFRELFADEDLQRQTVYPDVTAAFPEYFTTRPPLSPEAGSLLDALRAPILASPESLTGQLDFIREHWPKHLGEDLRRVLLAIDVLREEDIAIWMRFNPAAPDEYRHGAPGRGGEGFVGDEYVGFDDLDDYVMGPDGVRQRRRYAADYQAPLNEYEAFSADQAWMPTVVLMAKSTYVWLEQLSKKYARHIHRLDQIPQEELELLASRGITGLWLIGLWERSVASQTIKRLRGHTDAVASAYSLKEYRIADDLGGDAGYETLRDRAARVGLRLASDMVPNHMGIDSNWVIEHPDWFLYRWESPFPVYRFEGPDLSTDSRVEIKIEDHYYDQTDAAVAFRLRHHSDGATRYMYHGNDGTTFAWNDTAQLDYSKAAVREHVMQTILHVARLFPIIRFDAAMVLAKRHVQRLWFPLPGAGGSIPSRAEDAMSQEQFEALMPHEFWREVVDRVAAEVPGTLLLAEAFWLLEGYFVRTLGMHRVYNSAFMNMLRDEENAKYRSYLKKTVEFDPDILKRYVNFMSNPDERTAIDQFGAGDKYFGVSTLLATLPGLPMFGHGQIEGFTERYGMEFKQARMQEVPDESLVARHQREIAPLLKSRHIFAESANFVLYDFWNEGGEVDENVFAYSNRSGGDRALILYNNSYGSTRGTIHHSAASFSKTTGFLHQRSLTEGLAIPGDHSLVFAYRDTARNLEYLRRASDLEQRGLTVELHGYQYAVLLHWRELRSTSEHPWDRLCDALNGAGVPSVDEALSGLRLRPLHDALRQALSPRNLQTFSRIAHELARSNGVGNRGGDAVSTGGEPVSLEKPASPAGQSSSASAGSAPANGLGHFQSSASTPAPSLPPEPPSSDPRLSPLLQECEIFLDRVAEILPLAVPRFSEELPADGSEPETKQPTEIFLEACRTSFAFATHLPSLTHDLSEEWLEAAQNVLPSDQPTARSERGWGPILAWIILRSLPVEEPAATLFDNLRLRSALAEIFLSAGFEGENKWRAAAQVRVLLAHYTPPVSAAKTAPLTTLPASLLHSPSLWSDADIRWLAGVNQHLDITYFDKTRFEELLVWLQLPALIEASRHSPAPVQATSAIKTFFSGEVEAARSAGYNLEKYQASYSPEGESGKPESGKPGIGKPGTGKTGTGQTGTAEPASPTDFIPR